MKDITLTTYLECLRKTAPPSGIVHVGVGAGAGIMHHWRSWDIACAVLIDADANRHDWLKKTDEASSGYIFSETISDRESENVLYIATNSAESGLIPIEKLNRIWPNLETIETRDVKTTRLFTLLDSLPQDFTAQINWLVIDCFPALTLLEGVTDKYLNPISVLLLRVILDGDKVDESLFDAKLSVIEPFLIQQGYRLIVVEESNHPAVGLALFCKDWRGLLEPKLKNFENNATLLNQAKAELEGQLAALHGERGQWQETQQRLLQQLDEALAQGQAKEQTCLGLQAQLGEAADGNGLLSAAKAELEGQLAALHGERGQWQETQQRLLQQLDEALAQGQAKEQTCLGLQTQLGEAADGNGLLSAAKAELEGQLAALHGERGQWQETQQRLLQQLDEALAQGQAKEQTCLGLQAQLGEAADGNGLLSAAKAELEGFAALHGECGQCHQQLGEAKIQNQYQENNLIGLSNKFDETENLAKERLQRIQDAEQIIKDNNQRIMQLEADLGATATHQQMLNEEMLKAEAQIDLLKGVLLRDTKD